MLRTWKQEKATASLVDEAQVLADTLSTAKPHILESHAAAAQFSAAADLDDGQNLHELMVLDQNAGCRHFGSGRP